MATNDDILKMFQSYLAQSSEERQAQTKAFQESLDKLRYDMRIFNLLMLAAILVLAGVNVAGTASAGGGSLSLTPTAPVAATPDPDAAH